MNDRAASYGTRRWTLFKIRVLRREEYRGSLMAAKQGTQQQQPFNSISAEARRPEESRTLRASI